MGAKAVLALSDLLLFLMHPGGRTARSGLLRPVAARPGAAHGRTAHPRMQKRGLRPVSFTRAAYRVRPHARPRNRLRAAHSTSAPRAPSASGWLAGTGVTWPAGAGGVTICRSTML